MAGEQGDSNQDKNLSSSTDSFHEHNPFVAFRRFADEQIASMLQAVMGLPSSVSPPHSDHWAIFTEERTYNEPNYRQRTNGDDKEGEYPPSSGTGASGDTDNTHHEDDSSRSRWPRSDDPWHSNRRNRINGPADFFGFDSFFDSFFDRFWFDDRFSSRFFHPFHQPYFFSNMMNDDHATWPLAYLMFSPYSPLHLERQASYRAHRDRGVFSSLMSSLKPSSERDPAEPQWREAFEDLLRLENGKPMLDRQPSTAVAKKESGTEWLRGLVQRGSFGERWKYVSGTDGQGWSGITLDSTEAIDKDRYRPEDERADRQTKAEINWKDTESDTNPETELEMYDRFLEDIEAREREVFRGVYESPLLRSLLDEKRKLKNDIDSYEKQSRADDPESTAPDAVETTLPTSAPDQQPRVVSTRTTTERVRLSDGSIQTKTVKTKRFADGREETTESVEVVNSPHSSQDSPAGQESLENNQKRNGWFWRD